MTENKPTPNDMPGATESAVETDPTPDVVEAAPEGQPEKGLSPEKLAELNRKLRDERKAAERKARELEAKAQEAEQRWQQLAALFGNDKPKPDFDPQAEIQKMRSDLEAERTERLRSEVARTENVPPRYVVGSTEDEMRAAAAEYKADVQRLIDEAMKANKASSAPPASTVTSDGRIAGPDQITSHEELAKLPHGERMKAYREGRLNHLLGKSP